MKIRNHICRFCLIVCMTFIISVATFGQAAILVLILGDKVATEKFHLSIDGALNYSTLTGMNQSDYGFGLHFGLGTHIRLSEKWQLKPEFKPLSQKGAITKGNIIGLPVEITDAESRVRLNYLEIPVLLQYKINKNIFVSAGPQFSFLTAAKQINKGKLTGYSDIDVRSDVKKYFNTFDFCFPVEVGYAAQLSTKKTDTKMLVNFFFRYTQGFLGVMKDPQGDNFKNSTFQVGISLPFIKTAEELAKSAKE
jgi:hypothetical protein